MSLQLSLPHLHISHADQIRTKKKQNTGVVLKICTFRNTNIQILRRFYLCILPDSYIHPKKGKSSKSLWYFWRFGHHIVLPLFRYTYLLIYLLPYLLTPFSRVLLEKLMAFQLLKKFLAFYGTRRFIIAFTSAGHLSLSWAWSIWSVSPHPTSWRSILILSSHQCLGLTCRVLNSGFLTKTLYTPLLSNIHATRPSPSHSSRFYHLNITGWVV